MTSTINTPRIFKIIIFAALAYCLLFVPFSHKASAALDGEATTVVPNNGINTNGGSTNTFSPWLVVTRPGTNGMNAPSSKTYVYLPVVNPSTDKVTVTLNDGCDNSSIDSSQQNNNTKFFISKIANVNPVTTQVFSKSQPLTGLYELTCKDTGFATDTLTIWPRTSGDPSGWTDRITVDDIEYYKILIEARVVNDTSSLYYENRYRVSTSTTGSFVGYAESSGSGSSTLDYTGIGYGFASSSWGWSTKIGFAPKCSDSITTKKINFYDTDHANISGTPSSPFWQSNSYPMSWKLIEYNRRTRAFITESTGILTGGNNVVDPSSPTATFRPDRVYEIEISNINRVNSIQIQIPFDQIYSNDDCNSPPTGSVTASCSDAGVVTVKYSVNDTQDETLTTTFTAPELWAGNLVRSNAIGSDYTLGQFNFTGIADTNYTVQAIINDGNLNSSLISATYQCPGAAECSFVIPTATFYEPGDTITPKLKITRNNVSGAPPISVTASVALNGSPVSATSTNPITITLPTTEGYVDFTSRAFTDADLATGNFVYSGSVSWGSSRTASCGSVTATIVKKPYFIVTNGDSVIGGVYPSGTPASCSNTENPSDANAVSWATVSSATDRKGANVEHVAKVLGTAFDFYSAGGVSTSNKKWLTIANVSGDWGGNAGLATCMTDYHDTTKKVGISAINTDVTKSVQDLKTQAGTNEQIEINGNLTLSSTSEISGKLAVYVTGNVYINSNITQKASYSSRSDIPFFALIVKGNIYIGPTVDQLDGMYIAQPNGGSGGTIFTCGTSSFVSVEQSNVYSQCNNSLTFNGIVQAKDIKLHRTRGTLKNGPEAEKFNNLPELYMANTPFRSDSSSSSSYDSAVSLPPLL